MKLFGTLPAIGLAVSLSALGAQSPPSELSALVTRARLDGTVAAWCRGEFRSRHPGAFAVAMSSSAGGGRYLVLEADSSSVDLARFTRNADLSCYSRKEANELSASIARSTGIHGQITPRWNTSIVCAFVDDTTAVCWQYSPVDRAFVKVGGWIT